MNNLSRKSILTRCRVAACITLIPAIAMIVLGFFELNKFNVMMLLNVVWMYVLLFPEIFGICIEPRMYFRLVTNAFIGGAKANVFWGLIMIFLAGAIVGVKSFILGIKGIIYLIKNKEA